MTTAASFTAAGVRLAATASTDMCAYMTLRMTAMSAATAVIMRFMMMVGMRLVHMMMMVGMAVCLPLSVSMVLVAGAGHGDTFGIQFAFVIAAAARAGNFMTVLAVCFA